MRSKILPCTLALLGFAHFANAADYTTIYNHPPVGVSVTSQIPFTLDMSTGNPVTFATYVDAPLPEPDPPAPEMKMHTYVIFSFDSSRLTNAEKHKLATFAKGIDFKDSTIVIGRADPMGGAAYNLALSERRAQTIHQFLSSLGIENIRIQAEGDINPSVDCTAIKNRTQRIRCNEPNRASIVAVY